MESKHFFVRFESSPDRSASEHAMNCRTFLRAEAPDVKVELHRDDPAAMDFGSTLVLVLGTPSLIIFANALRDWIKTSRTAKVTIGNKDTNITVENISSRNAEDVIEKWLAQERQDV